MAWSSPTGYKKKLLLVVAAMLTLQHQHGTPTDDAGAGSSSLAKPGCQDKCGNVSIPYPFGIGKGCFLKEGFEVRCDKDRDSATLLNSTHQQVSPLLKINLLLGEARIQSPIAWHCNYTTEKTSIRFGPSFTVSKTKNKFTVIGCNTLAFVYGSNKEHSYYSTCGSFCYDKDSIDSTTQCTGGMGCCQTALTGNLEFLGIQIEALASTSQYQSLSPCSYGFVVAEDSFKFDPFYINSSYFQERYGLTQQTLWTQPIPLVIDWVVGNETCNGANACRGMNSVCMDTPNGLGYLCNCSSGFEGNPYLDGGCQQDINECDYPFLYPCHGKCHNTIGSYTCSCKPGTWSSDPKKLPCETDYGLNNTVETSHGLNNMVETSHGPNNMVIGISISFVFLIICISALLIKCQKRKLAKEKERFFKQNGGQILYQQILSRQVDTVTLFTLEDLKKATNNFDKSREVGIGGHGTVYKGILRDNKVVAIKRSKIINVVQTEEFVQEIIILSQINHKNVVRLIGCCLEVEVPILVYEFIPNGTLFRLIHGNHGRPPISLEVRLRIAQESAEALEYMHLSINRPIVHGDVKSLNILLDENYMAKVTDFGASRILPNDAVQLMTIVQGTLGYLDPEYLQERKLTEKSDVYSFGVVLLELITRKTAIYFEGPEEDRNLASSFLQAMKENRVEGLLDTSIIGVGMEELFQEVAQIASLCLRFKREERPSMTQVTDRLKAIRSAWREILLLKHEETERLAERLGVASTCALQPSMYWTARMMGMDVETPHADYAGTTNMGYEY
ncbi:wall-associated receptor kinase 5-like [Phragmites australis]|uniref:wall-associated receptor kinase 5-like n=1 Tax=Phragmites australis TaxID=29695 RepID=UPI002D76A266|nr:wall-associated receptor kinase 5-like [Phragmites australis]